MIGCDVTVRFQVSDYTQLSDFTVRFQPYTIIKVTNKVVNAPIKFEKIVMVTIICKNVSH